MRQTPPYTVLYVHDDKASHSGRTRLLRENGYRVIEAEYGKGPLPQISEATHVLILVDPTPPHRKGSDLYRQMKGDPTTAQAIIVQIVAHHTSAQQRKLALASGADCCLTEPLDPRAFLIVVEDMVHRSEIGQALYGVVGELRTLITDLGQRLGAKVPPDGPSSAELRSIADQLSVLERHGGPQLTHGLIDYLTQLVVTGRIKLRRVDEGHDSLLSCLTELSVLIAQSSAYTRSVDSDQGRDDLLRRFRALAGPLCQHGLSVTIHPGPRSNMKVALPEEQVVIMLQCIRELLFNTTKHATATHASVRVTISDETLDISVADSGTGFDPKRLNVTSPHAFGLQSVRHRIKRLDGKLTLWSERGYGTRATLSIPYAQ